MMEWLMKLANSWRPTQYCLEATKSDRDRDVSLWEREIQQYANGELSYAVVKGNDSIEDRSRVESNIFRTFVGVYDGHGGPAAAEFVNDHLFRNFENGVHSTGTITAEVLRQAFLTTDQELITKNRELAEAGSCCLVGVLSGQNLYVANAGDSRCVLGNAEKDGSIEAVQLSFDHNAADPAVRQALQNLHPEDRQIVTFVNNSWRLKGKTEVTRALGDIYLKDPSYTGPNAVTSLSTAAMTADPTIVVRNLLPADQFVVFASDGLWEHLSNEEVVQLVQTNPRRGIAGTLVKAAVRAAATKLRESLQYVKKSVKGRRSVHDDITVVVMFLDDRSACKCCYPRNLSIIGRSSEAPWCCCCC